MAKTALTMQFLLFSCVLSNHTSYKGYAVFEAIPRNYSDVELLRTFEDSNHYDFWTGIKHFNYPVNIMVDPEHLAKFTSILKTQSVQYHSIIRDVETTIRREREEMKAVLKISKGKISFATYHEYCEILNYLKQLSLDNPDLVKLETYGQSYEGRELIAVKIGNGTWTNPTIFIDSGMHAREWIGPAVSLYIIKQLAENKKNIKLVQTVNWIIIPVANPDGYEYSHRVDRLWRKTRSPNRLCYGVDFYRNFDYQWSSPSSDDECSGYFPGLEPFSDVETKAFRDFALGTENIVLYLTLHSTGRWIIYPYGNVAEPPMNWKELQALGENVAKAIKSVNGTEYTVGIQWDLLKSATSTSKDWMMGVCGVRLSYAMELPGGESHGFDPPITKIRPICIETWTGIKEFYNYIMQDLLFVDS